MRKTLTKTAILTGQTETITKEMKRIRARNQRWVENPNYPPTEHGGSDRRALLAEITRLEQSNREKDAELGKATSEYLLKAQGYGVRIAELERELTNAQANNHIRNLELDALHYVWCDGGCESGVHRFIKEHPPLTAEIVAAAERNTRRLRSWFVNAEGRKAQEPTVDARMPEWFRAHSEVYEKQIAELERTVARLREAAEWIRKSYPYIPAGPTTGRYEVCRYCGRNPDSGHLPECLYLKYGGANRANQLAESALQATDKPRCAEYTDKLPTTCDHLWNADHHNIPVGNCVKCGEPIQSYNRRMAEAWKRLQAPSEN